MCEPSTSRTLPFLVAAGAVVAIALALLVACERQAGPVTGASAKASAEEEVRAASAAWDQAHNAGDTAQLMQLYSEAAVSMPYNRPALEGRPAIEADFREFFTANTANHKTTIVSLQVLGDWAIERGHYEFTSTQKADGAKTAESGKHIVVRRKSEGSWKIQWEIWNTDAPPQAQ